MPWCIYCSDNSPPDFDSCVHCGASFLIDDDTDCSICGVELSSNYEIDSGYCMDCLTPVETGSDFDEDIFDDDDEDEDGIPF